MDSLSSRDISAIIKSCSNNGVSKLSFGNLSIEFHTQSKQEEQIVQVPMQAAVEYPQESLEQRAVKQKAEFEDLLEEARLANPGLYEDLIQLEETADAGDKA